MCGIFNNAETPSLEIHARFVYFKPWDCTAFPVILYSAFLLISLWRKPFPGSGLTSSVIEDLSVMSVFHCLFGSANCGADRRCAVTGPVPCSGARGVPYFFYFDLSKVIVFPQD